MTSKFYDCLREGCGYLMYHGGLCERHYHQRESKMTEYDSTADTLAHIDRVDHYLTAVIHDLERRADEHDASKLESPEIEVFDRVTPKLKTLTYNSPEYKASLAEMGDALDHHYAKNDHHPEHHSDGISGMDLMQLTEMMCDWCAAVERHDDGDIRKSIVANAARFGYGEEIMTLLLNTADKLVPR